MTRPCDGPSKGRHRRRDQDGAATVFAAVVAGVLLALGVGLGVVGAVVIDVRRAQAAADLAALAGAAAPSAGRDACGEVARVAGANGARVLSCSVAGPEVDVAVAVSGPRWLGLSVDPTARARAGPVLTPDGADAS